VSQFDPKAFTAQKAKPLPIILMLDRSGSMTGAKIHSLNQAVKRMLGTLVKEESKNTEFLLSTISFGETATLDHQPVPASAFVYRDLQANGGTPLGAAIDLAKALIEDRERTPSRAFRPLVVLASDGMPTDSWQKKLQDFVATGRSSKCDRMALAIGPEAISGQGRSTLDAFVKDTEHKVFEAHEADRIPEFFRYVTMSVVSRSLSANPDMIPKDATLTPPVRNGTKPAPAEVGSNDPKPVPPEEDTYW
jgi:uncharacterized protein YegL